MKIGVILDNAFDQDMRVKNEVESLVSAGHEVDVLCFNFGKNSSTRYRGARLHRITANKGWINKLKGLNNTIFNFYPGFWYRRILDFVKRVQPDVLHVHDLWMAEAAIRVKEKTGIPIILDLHENYVDAILHYRFARTFPGNVLISRERWAQKERTWLQQVDRIIVVIEEAKDRLVARGIDPDRIVVVPNYVHIREFSLKRGSMDPVHRRAIQGRFVLCYVGAFDVHRGLDIPIKAMKSVLQFIPQALLMLVGWGKNAGELIELARNMGVEASVLFAGYRPNDDIPHYIQASNVCLIPHYRTGHTDATIPHKLFQYMWMKKPVLVSSCKPLVRIVQDTGAGLSYKHDDVEDFAEKLRILYNSLKNTPYGERGHKAVREFYNWNTAAKALIHLYENTLNISHP